MKYLILSFLLLSTNAFAGVRVVGKGGGYGEMQAILINLQMASLTRICLEATNPCRLSSSQASSLAAASADAFILVLDPGCAKEEIEVLGKTSAKLSSCQLYSGAPEQSQVKEFREIAALVLSARLMSLSGLNAKNAAALAADIFQNFSQNEQSLAINSESGNFIFHILGIQSARADESIFSLEGATKTVNITAVVTPTLGCKIGSSQTPEFKIQSATSLSPLQILFEANATWSCENGQSWKGDLQILFETEKGEVKESRVHARMTGKLPL